MKRLSVLVVTLLFVSVLALPSASARSSEKRAQGAKKPMNPTQIAEMKKKRHAMKKEMHDIMLETIALIKEIATDEGAKAKAADLEKRLQKHITDMESYHKEHMGHKGKRMKGM